MRLKSIKLALFALFFTSFFSYAQVLPPGIANRNIHWPKDGPMGPQVFGTGVIDPNQTDQEKSGEDWWYDVKPIYENGDQVGYMTCGFTAHKNYYFDETGLNPQGFIQMPDPISFLKDPCERRTVEGEYASIYQQHIGRYDLNGNPIWCKHVNFGGPLMALTNTPDGGFIAVGETNAAYNHDNVIIKQNATLTISNCTIEFADTRRVNVDTKIVIEPGGRLIINNATLTSIQSCEKAMWDGIEVQGQPGQIQTPNSNQGFLSISSSTISNARNGAATTARNNDNTVDWTKTGGGIIIATNSNFINNYASFGFMKYTPYTASGALTNDKSGILKCNFTTTDDFGDGGMTTEPYAQIIMWDTKNVRIQGNTFTNYRMNVPIIERGTGILSVDAAFVVKPGCTSSFVSPGGCPPINEVKNEFHNLYTGIAISNINKSPFTIDKTIFNNNLYGAS